MKRYIFIIVILTMAIPFLTNVKGEVIRDEKITLPYQDHHVIVFKSTGSSTVKGEIISSHNYIAAKVSIYLVNNEEYEKYKDDKYFKSIYFSEDVQETTFEADVEKGSYYLILENNDYYDYEVDILLEMTENSSSNICSSILIVPILVFGTLVYIRKKVKKDI